MLKKKVNSYFIPQPNIAYERQEFRRMEIEENETISQFVFRLKIKPNTVAFTNAEEIREHMIENCWNPVSN